MGDTVKGLAEVQADKMTKRQVASIFGIIIAVIKVLHMEMPDNQSMGSQKTS